VLHVPVEEASQQNLQKEHHKAFLIEDLKFGRAKPLFRPKGTDSVAVHVFRELNKIFVLFVLVLRELLKLIIEVKSFSKLQFVLSQLIYF